MSDDNSRLSNVDVLLGEMALVTVPTDVQQRLEARIEEFFNTSQPENVSLRTAPPTRTRRWFVAAAAAASVAAVAIAASLLVLGSRDAWAQVVKSMQAKPWVRFTVQMPEELMPPEGAKVPGGKSEPPVTWLSSKHNIAASKRGPMAGFMDLARQEVYSYNAGTGTVTLESFRGEQLADLGFLETLRRLVSSEQDSRLGLPESPVQIISRSQTDVEEQGHRWTEFTFQCRNPAQTPADYRVIVRVDPESGLPVELRSTEGVSPEHPNVELTLAIDYPDSGPTDIYAMGAPMEATFIDRRPVVTENGDEINEFLAAYRAAANKPLGAAEVEVVQGTARGPIPEASASELPGELMVDRVGYPSIMMGQSPVGNPDCQVTLDRRPQTGPEETVLLHILVEASGGSNDCYYWIAPEQDYLVLRYEIHFSGREHHEWHNSTRVVDEVEQSPSGRWYPSVVRYGRIRKHGDDLPSERVPASFDNDADRDPMDMGPVTTMHLRYDVTFADE